MTRRTLNVAKLPDHAFGNQGFIWWGTVSYMVIEGTMFGIVLAAYFFLRTRNPVWPPSAPEPDPMFGTIGLVLLFASAIPNQMVKTAAERYDVARVRRLLPVLLAFAAAVVVVRAFEFSALGVRWDYNAYASIVWVILGLHTTHLVTDLADSIVLAVLVFAGHTEARRMVDVSENSLYWYFIILSWIPVYLTIYFAPRWL